MRRAAVVDRQSQRLAHQRHAGPGRSSLRRTRAISPTEISRAAAAMSITTTASRTSGACRITSNRARCTVVHQMPPTIVRSVGRDVRLVESHTRIRPQAVPAARTSGTGNACASAGRAVEVRRAAPPQRRPTGHRSVLRMRCACSKIRCSTTSFVDRCRHVEARDVCRQVAARACAWSGPDRPLGSTPYRRHQVRRPLTSSRASADQASATSDSPSERTPQDPEQGSVHSGLSGLGGPLTRPPPRPSTWARRCWWYSRSRWRVQMVGSVESTRSSGSTTIHQPAPSRARRSSAGPGRRARRRTGGARCRRRGGRGGRPRPRSCRGSPWAGGRRSSAGGARLGGAAGTGVDLDGQRAQLPDPGKPAIRGSSASSAAWVKEPPRISRSITARAGRAGAAAPGRARCAAACGDAATGPTTRVTSSRQAPARAASRASTSAGTGSSASAARAPTPPSGPPRPRAAADVPARQRRHGTPTTRVRSTAA